MKIGGAPKPLQANMDRLQGECYDWVAQTMDNAEVYNVQSRAKRFTEEAIELAQAAGLAEEEVLTLVAHVYSKPIGEPAQEAGGVTLTLAALCNALQFCWSRAVENENIRCWKPEIRAKVNAKWQRIRERQQLPGDPPI